MWFPRRRPDALEQLLRARFSAFVTLPGGLHAMVTVTRLVVIVRTFAGAVNGDPLQTWHFERRETPESLHDGQGFNLTVLQGFLSGLGITHSSQESNMKTRDKKKLALYASMARMTRQKQRGGSCLMLPCQAIRQYIPAMKAEMVKFFLLAASHGDELGRAFAGVDHFWSMGYHPEKTTKKLRELEALGLMRYTRLNERDPKTGWYLPNAYQFNPALYYVRKALRPAALAISEKPFCDIPMWERLIGRPDRSFPSHSDHNQRFEPKPESKIKNQSQLSKASNHHHHQNSAFENGGGGQNSRRDEKTSAAAQQKSKEQGQEQKASLPAPEGASQTPAPHGAKIPQPPSSERPPSRKADFEQPLADDSAELLAQMIKSDFGTRLWQARELVCEFGVAHVAKARDMVIEEKRKRYVKTEIGLMRHWLSKGMVAVEEQARAYNPYDDGHGFAHAGD